MRNDRVRRTADAFTVFLRPIPRYPVHGVDQAGTNTSFRALSLPPGAMETLKEE